MRKKWSAVLLAVLAVSVFAGCGARQTEEAKVSAAEALETDSEGSAAADPEETTAAAEASEQESRPRGPFEAFTAADLEGNPVSEEIFKDYDLTMINIWATFCGPCISEMPDLGKLNEEWKEKGVVDEPVAGIFSSSTSLHLRQVRRLSPSSVSVASLTTIHSPKS